MHFCVPSIMHSGTRFVCEQVLKGYRSQNLLRPSSRYPRSYYRAHMRPDAIRLLEPYLQRFPCIIPMRHPARIAKSFDDRGIDRAEYLEQWRLLMALWSDYGGEFVHIDLPDIEKYTRRVGWLTGHSIEVDRNKKYTDHFNINCSINSHLHWPTDSILEFYSESTR